MVAVKLIQVDELIKVGLIDHITMNPDVIARRADHLIKRLATTAFYIVLKHMLAVWEKPTEASTLGRLGSHLGWRYGERAL